MDKELSYATEYTLHTSETLDRVKDETGYDIEVRYWNRQYHILVDKRHVYCGNECECRAFMDGIVFNSKMTKRNERKN